MKAKSRTLKGIPVSPGIAIGSVHLLQSEDLTIPRYWLAEKQIRAETTRFQQALKKTQRELLKIKEKICQFQVGDQIRIIESHQMIAADKLLVDGTLDIIREEKINSEWAFEKTLEKLKESFLSTDDPYFIERRDELSHVGHRILQHLMGFSGSTLRHFPKNSVIVAYDLSPADTAQMVKGTVEGFITETGGPTSHSAILAKALEIPAVVGLDDIVHQVNEGDTILVDGIEGQVFINPSTSLLEKYRQTQKKYHVFEQLLLKEAHLPATTQDGYAIRLAANMEIADEIASIKKHGAEGVGLYRTETFYMLHDHPPTEEEQFQNYRDILRKLSPHPVTIRTLDIGGDKIISHTETDEGINPALGLRGIRYSLKERELFKTQLRAILRASEYGPIKIMIPMVTTLEEVRQTKKILADVRSSLHTTVKNEEHLDSNNVKLGIMIETPAAALMADEMAREVDFFSIGTNDLVQYTLVVDRVNEEVSYLYEPFNPSILRLLKRICDAGRDQNIDVSLCGEMAGNPVSLLLLLGLGLTELSMNAVSIPRVKKLLRTLTFRQAKEVLDKSLACKTASEVEAVIRRESARIPGFPTL